MINSVVSYFVLMEELHRRARVLPRCEGVFAAVVGRFAGAGVVVPVGLVTQLEAVRVALALGVAEFSRSYLQQRIEAGDVLLDGRQVLKAAARVRLGQQVDITLRATPHSFATRLLPRLSKSAGIIAPRRILTQIDSSFDMDRLARKLKGADLATRARRLS